MENNVLTMSEEVNYTIQMIRCDCGHEQCDIVMEFDYDNEFDMVSLCFYTKLNWYDKHDYSSWFGDLYVKWRSRISAMWSIMIKGELRCCHSFYFKGEQHIDDLIKALEDGKAKYKSFGNKKEYVNLVRRVFHSLTGDKVEELKKFLDKLESDR